MIHVFNLVSSHSCISSSVRSCDRRPLCENLEMSVAHSSSSTDTDVLLDLPLWAVTHLYCARPPQYHKTKSSTTGSGSNTAPPTPPPPPPTPRAPAENTRLYTLSDPQLGNSEVRNIFFFFFPYDCVYMQSFDSSGVWICFYKNPRGREETNSRLHVYSRCFAKWESWHTEWKYNPHFLLECNNTGYMWSWELRIT